MLQACRVFWSREPDAWDAQWEAEEQLRRQQAQQVGGCISMATLVMSSVQLMILHTQDR